jgi:hypothetical protein
MFARSLLFFGARVWHWWAYSGYLGFSHAANIPLRAQPLPNPALNLVRFALWTLRDKAAQRWLALR